ncbi:DUF927 domain-containing protein [Streptomyces sp. BRA346]|uniref:DUF927 domain-containing protein n=1 Tax=Streptomyces sp. BRA346 TaxID=2878199 RepID=UPI004063B659
MAQKAQQEQASEPDVPPQRRRRPVSNLERGGTPAGCRPIAGMKKGWYYNENDRTILHRQNPEDTPLVIGQVPKITAQIVHLTDDGEDIRTEYLALGKRQRRGRILTEDELDRGTWAAKMGMRRPTGSDERHAFARLIREEGDAAPVTSARTYYDDNGDLVFPAADAQTLGYRVLRGEEKAARDAWDEIGAWMTMDGKSALVAGGYFAGPVLDTLDMLAHMISVHGPGQQGKSTILVVCAACYGDIKPKRQSLWMTWNASKQGITQNLRLRGYLPLALDEHSSSGRTIKESSREISQMVAGAIRAMGTADGSPRESDGFWHSVVLSSSNEPLKHEGQTEDLASRLQEFKAPFFPNRMVDAEGAPTEPGHKGAEHISKRLKRLAKDHGGWPVEWAVRLGMYRAENLAQLRKLHLELCAKYRPAQGGVAATIAELHMAWVVGAHMLGQAIGIPGLGAVAETEAAARLAEAIEISAEANIPDSERLWNALDSLRIEASAFPEIDKLPSVAEEGFRRLRGFTDSENSEWWVINPVVQEAAAQAGIDNVSAALRHLDELNVHIRGTGKNAQRKLPKSIRGAGLGERMHCFNTLKAAELFSPDDEPEDGPRDEFPGGATPGGDPGATGVAPENEALTSSGATGATGATLELFDFSKGSDTTSETVPGTVEADEATASRAHDVTTAGVVVPPMPTAPPAVPYPKPVAAVTHQAFADLVAKATGRTASALRFGVLGSDEAGQGWLYLPNHERVRVPLPGRVDDVPELLAAYGLKTLWAHETAALAMGLPTYEERVGEDLAAYKGAQAPTPHPWATPASDSGLVVHGDGLSAWMTLKTDGGRGQRLSVALPLYEDRFDRADEPARGGWGAAPTPETLLDALMVYLVGTVHGPADRPQVIPYYLSPNTTAKDYADIGREHAVSPVIRSLAQETEAAAGPVPPVRAGIKPLIDMQWTRPAEDITEDERAATWLHQFDKNAAWLGAFGAAALGLGDPTHHPDGRAFDPKKAGYWRVADIPGHGLEGLPPLRIYPADEGGYWLRTPGLALVRELYPDWEPQIVQAWVWESSGRALYGMYDRIRVLRERIAVAAAAGHPGARYAKQVSGALYQSFRGYLGRIEPKRDHATGAVYEGDIYWRPDWAQTILDLAAANTYRNLLKFAAEGRLPLSLRVDAATYTSDHADPADAKPAAMEFGTKGHQWKPEQRVPMADLLPLLDAGKKMSAALKIWEEGER